MTQSLVVQKCPEDLPNVEVNKIEFETGFEEQYVVGGFPSNWYQCSICQGFPRHPVSLMKCGHLFCECCLKGLFDTSSWLHPHALDGYERTAFCPMCKMEFTTFDVFIFEAMQQWSKSLFLSITIQCPYECGFNGNAKQVDEHQVFRCPKRIVACPHLDCPARIKSEEMEKHFPECDFRRVFCNNCRLPVFATQEWTHNCMDRLKAALLCKFLYYLLIVDT